MSHLKNQRYITVKIKVRKLKLIQKDMKNSVDIPSMSLESES